MTEAILVGCRVLVVEDEPLISMLLEDLLTDFGCVLVGTSTKVDQALHQLQHNEIDLAILDVNLDGHESYPVADEMIRRGVPFVFSTGLSSDHLIAKYAHHPTLTKPFRHENMATVLSQALLINKG